jgi:glutaredoxin-like protein NrdH
MVEMEHVKGQKKAKILLYALSTCVWCRKTRQLLDSLAVDYYYVYVDQLEGDVKEQAIKEIEKWNPRCSFPTVVINEKDCIVGFKEDEIRKAVGI